MWSDHRQVGPARARGAEWTRPVESAARAADARRADQPGRDERAQRPLLHDQGAGAAADPARPLRLLHRPTTSPASSWSRSCRATASRWPRSRSTSPASRADATPEDIALHRTMLAPVAARGCRRDDPRRAGQARRAHAGRRRPGHADRAGHRAPQQARAATRSPSPSCRSASGLLDLGFPTEAALAAADVYAEHGRQIAQELYERVPDQGRGRPTRSPGPRRSGCGRSSSGSSRCPSPAWSRPTSPPWTRPSARASPGAAR